MIRRAARRALHGGWERRVYAPDLREMTRTASSTSPETGWRTSSSSVRVPRRRLAWASTAPPNRGHPLVRAPPGGPADLCPLAAGWRDDSGAARIFLARWPGRLGRLQPSTPHPLHHAGRGCHLAAGPALPGCGHPAGAVMRDMNGDGRRRSSAGWGRALGIQVCGEARRNARPGRFRHRLWTATSPSRGRTSSPPTSTERPGRPRLQRLSGTATAWERREIPAWNGSSAPTTSTATAPGSSPPGPAGWRRPRRLGNHLIWLKPLAGGRWAP